MDVQSLEQGLEPFQHSREDPLGLGDRQAAQGEGRTGDAVAAEQAGFLRILPAQFGQLLAQAAALAGADVAEQDVLVGGESQLQLEGVHQLPQPRLLLAAEASAEQGEPHEPEASALAVPAQVILQFAAGFGAQAPDRMAEIVALELVAEPVDAAIVDQVFHAGVAPLHPIAVVPLQGHDRLHQIEHMLMLHVAEGVGRTGEGLLLVMGAAHAATHIHIAALGPALGVREQHQAHVLGEQVHGVVAGHGDGHLELSRHVGAAIEGLLAIAAEHPTLPLAFLHPPGGGSGFDPVAEIAVHPHVQVRPFSRLGSQQVGDVIGQLAGRRIPPLGVGGRRGHHIAVDIATGGQGGTQVAHDRADHLPEVLLVHPVHLEGLAGGDPQRAVAQPVGQLVHGQKEVAGDAAAGTAQPQHHLPVLLTTLLAVVAIVLLVTAVKLQNLNCVLTEIGQLVAQLGVERLAQMVAARLQLLELGGPSRYPGRHGHTHAS